MNILLLGNGGREHALAHALVKSDRCEHLYVAPGNGGTALIADNVELNPEDPAAVVAFAQEHHVELVVIGPEVPLIAGVADAVRAAGLLCFGPSKAGARLEGSKSFSKDFMISHNIPTAQHQSFDAKEPALEFAGRLFAEGATAVAVKADGLAAGKGVTVAQSLEEAADAIQACLDGRFGKAGLRVVVEEGLTGPECSLMVLTDGGTMHPLVPAQDHKRALAGDKGPNTGGMGCYSPVPVVGKDDYATMLDYMQRAVDGLAQDGIDYQGVLYGGFMLTEAGPKLLEFNARFGDPETQVVLPRLKTDLLEVLLATAQKRLDTIDLVWAEDWAVTVVLTSAGYPGDYETGKPITGIDEAQRHTGVTVYYAGVSRAADGSLLTSGGRVLAVTGEAPTFAEARRRAYAAVDDIHFEGKTYRTDVALRALQDRSSWF